MSVRCTVAGFEQHWHFMPPSLSAHKPTLCVVLRGRWALLSTLFQPANVVADLGGFLIGFPRKRLVQLLPQYDQFGLFLFGLGQAARGLSAVASFAVDVLEERSQLLAKCLV